MSSSSLSSPPPAQTLTGRIAIVSGSSSGIGAAIARELSLRGAIVVINYPFPHLQSEAEAVLASLPGPSSGHATDKGIAIEADISTTDGPAKLVAATVQRYGQVDILVNNAALAVNLPFEEQTLEHWDRLVNLNGRGTFLLTQAVLPHLPKPSTINSNGNGSTRGGNGGGGGRIINIVSISSRGPPPMQTIYAGTKGMVDSFTRCWAKELPPKYGCTVNAVSPGPTRTEGFAAAGDEVMQILQPVIDQTPVAKRMAEGEEIAYVVGCLAEERARWVNGAHICATGGLFID